jgi:hypothetical protein
MAFGLRDRFYGCFVIDIRGSCRISCIRGYFRSEQTSVRNRQPVFAQLNKKHRKISLPPDAAYEKISPTVS